MGIWEQLGQVGARFAPWSPDETEEERRQREEQEAIDRIMRENILSEPILVRDEIARYEQAAGLRRPDRTNIEDRRFNDPTRRPLPEEIPAGPLTPPEGWPNGWENTFDPRWLEGAGAPGVLRSDAPGSVHRGIEESAEWRALRAERPDLEDGQYEPTDSPLVLRKRNPNGTVTYVHAMTGAPLFEDGEYGMNDPQGAEPGQDAFDPFWRAGRRDW